LHSSFTSKRGPIVGVQPIATIDDKQVEGDEALFMNARVDSPRSRSSSPGTAPC